MLMAMSSEVFSAVFAGIAVVVAVVAAIYSKKSAIISALEFRSKAPRLEAAFSIDRWHVVNAGHSTAYNVQIQCHPHPCNVEMMHPGTLAEGKRAWVFPADYTSNQSISMSWTRTPEGGRTDKPVTKVVHDSPEA